MYYNYLLEFGFSRDLLCTDVARFDILQDLGRYINQLSGFLNFKVNEVGGGGGTKAGQGFLIFGGKGGWRVVLF